MKMPVRLRLSILRVLLVFVSPVCAFASNSVVNMSHYDLMRVDFVGMKSEGIVGVIHEASYPRYERDAYYRARHEAAARAGLLWGAYHFADATNPVRQADHFLNIVSTSMPHTKPDQRPPGVLLVLDFEKNGHYPGGTMNVGQAVAFVERIRERTGTYPGLYSNEYRVRSVLNSASPAQKRVLTKCWLWLANYTFEPRNTAPWSGWRLWQYTGDGKCLLRPRSMYPKGIANIKHAERNIFRGNNAALENFWQEHSWRPQG